MMKSTNSNANQELLISRKKPQTTKTVIYSLVGFLLFLTGGFVFVASLIDAVLNGFVLNTVLAALGGLFGCKIGRVIMRYSVKPA